ncbi:MAG: phosphoribosylformimino-5-aminoimidazole carboxamide ribotide isomerase [Lachnospiraceae bacterium]|nr:phosphoribosylformimino-5-aminoimidazole carboxamide ribotide isomerase [Lachnospiraceae bacterium]
MKFRPCIDIHNGKVKQIVGSSLLDEGDRAKENFVSQCAAAFYANYYRERNIKGGHIILLNPASSEYYEETKAQALSALHAYPDGMQIGGGIHSENAREYIEEGASHVIVTSFVFRDGRVNWDNLEKLVQEVGRERIVLDLSCRKWEDSYFVVTDRWQKFTDEKLSLETLDKFSPYCDEFLIHAVDVEGRASGVEKELAVMLGEYGKIPVTYAGGVGSYEDIETLRTLGKGRLDVTIGSALDLFGGSLEFEKVLALMD